ncbi:MAG: isochorismatase [Desulfobacterales bacterium]|nr:MAG: isochorismatase [Desulfobacterales bacterium]
MEKKILVTPGECCLHIIDPHRSLMDHIYGAEKVVRVMELMFACAKILDIPIVASTQYKKGLGPFVAPIQTLVDTHDIPCQDKLEFSAYKNGATADMMKRVAGDVSTVILIGVETHICIYQSAAALLEMGYQPWIVADGVSSRSQESHVLGLQRLQALGAVVGPAEMIIYELLGKAGTPQFKQVLQHIISFDKKEQSDK